MTDTGTPTTVLRSLLASYRIERANQRKAEADRIRSERARLRAEKQAAIEAAKQPEPWRRITSEENAAALKYQQLAQITHDTLRDLGVVAAIKDADKRRMAETLIKQASDAKGLYYGFNEILSVLDKAYSALPTPTLGPKWRKLNEAKVTIPGAYPGEFWDTELNRYIFSPAPREIQKIKYTFEDGSTIIQRYNTRSPYSPEYVRGILERKKKQTVKNIEIIDHYYQYLPRNPPLPGPVPWPKWKQRPEDWKYVSKDDLMTPGRIPDALWSDRLGRYVLPSLPRLVTIVKDRFTDQSIQTFTIAYPSTPSLTFQRRMVTNKTGAHYSYNMEYSQSYRYKMKPYEKSDDRLFNLPVELTPLIDDDFEKKKDQFNNMWGYSVEMPDWEDIFHFKLPVRLSAEEKLLYRTKQYNLIDPARLEQIRDYKVGQKIRLRRALASPTPKIARAISTFSTTVDNAQDTLITAAMFAKIAAKVFPKFARRIAGAYGVLSTGADILNIMALFTLMPFIAKSLKRGHFNWSSINPFSKTARTQRAANFLKWKPTWAEIIQAAQVSDSVCGFGLCLGPLIGWAEDYVTGEVRDAIGQKVTWSQGAQKMRLMTRASAAFLLRCPMLLMTGQGLTDEEHLHHLFAALGATRFTYADVYDDQYTEFAEDPTGYMVKAPQPQDPILIENLLEEGVDIEATSVWPQTGTQWASINDLMDIALPEVLDNLRAFLMRNNNNDLGVLAGSLVCQLATESLALYGGEHNVNTGHVPETMVAHNLLMSQNYLPYDYTQDHVKKLAHYISAYHQMAGEIPPTQEVLKVGKEAGILWRHELPREPVGKAAELFPDYLELKAKYGADSFIS